MATDSGRPKRGSDLGCPTSAQQFSQGERTITDHRFARHPTNRVNLNILCAGGDRLWTSAGVTAGIDRYLNLARVGGGSAPVAAVARSIVAPVFCSSGQPQFIPPIRVKPARESSMKAVQLAMLKDVRP